MPALGPSFKPKALIIQGNSLQVSRVNHEEVLLIGHLHLGQALGVQGRVRPKQLVHEHPLFVVIEKWQTTSQSG